mgnify:CR=1 FL=1|tara:strand:- start:1887 stop:2093 length:207 start_codon:yes stop_codon:yes gene_type:complete
MEYVLLIWINSRLFYVDTLKDVNKCRERAEYLFRNKKQYEYICAPDNNKTKQKKIDGLFNKGMLKDIK